MSDVECYEGCMGEKVLGIDRARTVMLPLCPYLRGKRVIGE